MLIPYAYASLFCLSKYFIVKPKDVKIEFLYFVYT